MKVDILMLLSGMSLELFLSLIYWRQFSLSTKYYSNAYAVGFFSVRPLLSWSNSQFHQPDYGRDG